LIFRGICHWARYPITIWCEPKGYARIPSKKEIGGIDGRRFSERKRKDSVLGLGYSSKRILMIKLFRSTRSPTPSKETLISNC
jgi:hypothetical protein